MLPSPGRKELLVATGWTTSWMAEQGRRADNAIGFEVILMPEDLH
jgi:hypothetical protein